MSRYHHVDLALLGLLAGGALPVRAQTPAPAPAAQAADLAGFWQGEVRREIRTSKYEWGPGKNPELKKLGDSVEVRQETAFLLLRPEGVWGGTLGKGFWRVTCDSGCRLWLISDAAVTSSKTQQNFHEWYGALLSWAQTTPRSGQPDTVGSAHLTAVLAKLAPRDSLFWAKVGKRYAEEVSVYPFTLAGQQLSLGHPLDNAALQLSRQDNPEYPPYAVGQLGVVEGVLKRQ